MYFNAWIISCYVALVLSFSKRAAALHNKILWDVSMGWDSPILFERTATIGCEEHGFAQV